MLSLKNSLPLVLFIPLFLTACNTPSQAQQQMPSELAGAQNISGEIDSLFNNLQVETKPSYVMQVKRAVDAQLGDLRKYKGKSCTVQLTLKRDGKVESATIEKGDADSCKILLTAIHQASIPEAPDEQAWQKYRNIAVDLIPYK